MNRETKNLRQVWLCDADWIQIYVDVVHSNDGINLDKKNITREVMEAKGEDEGGFTHITLGSIADYIKEHYSFEHTLKDGTVINCTPVAYVKNDMGLSGVIYRLFNYEDSIEEYAKTRGYA